MAGVVSKTPMSRTTHLSWANWPVSPPVGACSTAWPPPANGQCRGLVPYKENKPTMMPDPPKQMSPTLSSEQAAFPPQGPGSQKDVFFLPHSRVWFPLSHSTGFTQASRLVDTQYSKTPCPPTHPPLLTFPATEKLCRLQGPWGPVAILRQ